MILYTFLHTYNTCKAYIFAFSNSPQIPKILQSIHKNTTIPSLSHQSAVLIQIGVSGRKLIH